MSGRIIDCRSKETDFSMKPLMILMILALPLYGFLFFLSLQPEAAGGEMEIEIGREKERV